MRRYPALHAARSEYRGRRATALGLPVLAVLSWMAAGLLHQPPGPVPLVRHVTNIEDSGPSAPPEEIAQSALRPPKSPAPAPRGSSDQPSRALAAGPRLTPAATSRPLPPARPALAPRPAPTPSGGRPDPREAKETRRPETGAPTEAGGPRPSGTDAARLAETVAAATSPTTVPSPSSSTALTRSTGEPSPVQTRSEPSAARAASTESPSAAPVPTERRTSLDPGPVPREYRECHGLLLPLFGCPAWTSVLWGP
ncbi:hypothetical protein [Actinocorallia populi]|uniref:hypothetical protein n=1 Tax=Actinocorallia populi TaxID=2079200 RepID=UPI0013008C6E|nr:hypothetical protein [Actinocorallia populi]